MKNKIKNTLRNLVIVGLLLLVFGSSAWAQVSKSKSIAKTFKVDKSTIVDIGNKYGDICFETWAKDSVSVEIEYAVTEKNNERLKKKMSEISFELTQSGHYVVVNTIIGNSKNMFLSELVKLKETIGVGGSQVEINMKVKLPDNLDLRVNYKGDLTLELSNGKLKAHDLTGYVNLKLSFGDAIIKTIDTGNLEVYYSDFNLSSSRKLRINSKTSDITITEIEQLFVNSSRDDYRIRMIGDFETEASWTDFSISEFKYQSDIRMNYGELTIENIQPSMENILIDARATRISLFFNNEIDVNFDIITNKDLNLPMDASIDSTESINEKEKIMRYLGRTGDVEKGEAKLILNTSSADISILKR
jgi:uncharacterized protein (DUF2141 family)